MTRAIENAMKAYVRDRYGSPDVLALQEIAKPALKDGDVLVRVRAASLNQGDLDYLYGRPFLTRMGIGLRRPRQRGLGFDAAGVVEAVGQGVSRFKPGDEVFADATSSAMLLGIAIRPRPAKPSEKRPRQVSTAAPRVIPTSRSGMRMPSERCGARSARSMTRRGRPPEARA
jgi:NADPH:quinone reductase-like Zn-dependent oxidoreductase